MAIKFKNYVDFLYVTEKSQYNNIYENRVNSRFDKILHPPCLIRAISDDLLNIEIYGILVLRN